MSTKNTDKITPGPWLLSVILNPLSDSAPAIGFCIEHTDGKLCSIVAECRDFMLLDERGTVEGNARLIAAAPDLLEAAELCIALCKEIGATETNAYAQARAALAKATGGT